MRCVALPSNSGAQGLPHVLHKGVRGGRDECCCQGYQYIVHSASTNLSVCMCTSLPRVLWYVFIAQRHETSLQSSGEGQTLPTSTVEGSPLVYTSTMSLCYPLLLLPPPSPPFPLPSLVQVGLLGAYTAGTYVDSMWGVAQFSLSNESVCLGW